MCGTWDHPRSRGVYSINLLNLGVAVGSSPLARGLPEMEFVLLRDGGIIPARAGFTQKRGEHYGEYWDHPRSRGVYSPTDSTPTRAAGSSPLARGLLVTVRLHPDGTRIIPARAGFT